MNDDKAALFAALARLGIKHSPEKVVRIAKQADSKIVFLEKGTVGIKGSGLAHILQKHQEDFEKRGISENEIPDAVMAAVTRGTLLGYQGTREPRRPIYEVIFNGKIQYIAVTVSDNGYIVGANPAALP